MAAEPEEAESGVALTVLDEDRLAWLALVLTPGLGPRRIVEAMRQLSAPCEVFGLPLTGLEALRFPAGVAQFVFEGKAREAAEREWQLAQRHGVELVTLGCAAFPERLKEIFDPPPVLWVRGAAGLLARPSIAIVGTRKPTPYGTGIAEMLGRDLSARGMLIVSGMARGIDTYAHKGALLAGRPTLAVWGTGADVIYPKENKKLAEDILAMDGAIISEVPLGTFPAPQNFPRRNRIISGLSLGVLVVEASENSGTRVTARCAADQGRDVFAVPGNVTSKNSWTPNTLIKQGAQLTATWEDIWETLPSQVRIELESGWGSQVESKSEMDASDGAGPALLPGLTSAKTPLRGREAIVLNALRQDAALQMDEILDLLEPQLSSAEVFTALFELELAGRIRSLPGKNYVRHF
jgi:DNA processing protein